MKKPKAEVDYGMGHKDSHCGRSSKDDAGFCRHFRSPPMFGTQPITGSCVKVIGNISRTHWCKLFEKAE